jgi:TetR/AcrR family transcriptional regulator, cholesterol catabolism regulator
VLFWHQETKNVKPELRQKLMAAEMGLVVLFENIIKLGQKDRVFDSQVDSRLAARNIIVLADMGAFRRWGIGKHYISEVFINKQVDFIMRSLLPREN